MRRFPEEGGLSGPDALLAWWRCVDQDIVVTVVEIRGDKVRLGIEAPREVPVHRREVYDAIKESEKSKKD